MFDIASLSNFFNLLFVLKIFFLVVAGGFVIFTIVVLNQVRVMNNVVRHAFISSFLSFLSLLLVLAALSLFLIALGIL